MCQDADVSVQLKAGVDMTNLRPLKGEFSTSFSPLFAWETLHLQNGVHYHPWPRAVKDYLWSKWPERYPAMGQPVIKCLQGDYLWQAPAATAGDGVCVCASESLCGGIWGYGWAPLGLWLEELWVEWKQRMTEMSEWLVCANLNLSHWFKSKSVNDGE